MVFLRLASSVALATACVVMQGCGSRSCDDLIALMASPDADECDGLKDKECTCSLYDEIIEACSEDTGNEVHQLLVNTSKSQKASLNCGDATFAQA